MTKKRLWVGSLAVVVLGGAAVGFVKYQDTDNRFCVACHLHEEFYRKSAPATGTTLSAEHFRAHGAGHPERCFTCHSGEGVAGWSQVTALSAVDAARWVLGDRHEPTSMRLPLENAACLKCHANDIRPRASGEDEGAGTGAFHQVRDHRKLTVPCMACHTVHTEGVKPNLFLDDAVVQRQCTRCHPNGTGTESEPE